jgi:SAM-dependent methyltransferase
MNKFSYHDQRGDQYHKVRHKEIFGNDQLLKDWGDYADYRYFSCIDNGASVLEVGAGTGINMMSLKNRTKVSVIEPSDYARQYCESKGLIGYKDISDISKNDQFDFIFMRHVLEHLHAPFDMLLQIQKRLQAKGLLILIVPIESAKKQYSPNDIDHHLFCWNPQTLCNLVQESGFTINRLYINSFNGRRLFSGLKKSFGVAVYAAAMHILGTLRQKSEIVIHARPEDNLVKNR